VELIHTCYRITPLIAPSPIYEALGFEKRRELPIRERGDQHLLGIPGKELLELELPTTRRRSYEPGPPTGTLRSL